jgi:bifunctional polynucleotide phosphatase/kinase
MSTPTTVTKYVIGVPTGTKSAGFDLDGTLFQGTTSTPYPGALQKLQVLISEDYNIVIISNQLRLKDSTIAKKIDTLAQHYQIPMEIYISRARDQYRKPEIGILSLLDPKLGKLEFCVGDAGGRAGDFSDSDLKFAENAGIPFYTPEQFFTLPSSTNSNSVNTTNTNLTNTSDLKITELDNNAQAMIIMVGYPSAGKTSLSKNIPGVERISQDELKTKAKCLSTCRKLLKAGKSVVIDRTNPSTEPRSEFIALAQEAKVPVVAVHVNTSFEESDARNQKRALETGVKAVPKIAYYTYRKNFQIPEVSEGFSNIYTV